MPATEFQSATGVPTSVSPANPLPVTLTTGDIEIGAVELKDGATDTRATINAANTVRAVTDNVVLVQSVDASGKVGGTNLTKIADQTVKQGVTIASSVVTGEQNVLPEAIYRGTSLSKIDGQVSLLESDSAGNEKITHATWERGADMSFDLIKVQQRATKPAAPLTASALVFTGAGQLMGWVVNSCSTGATLKIWDNTSAATTVAFDTMTYTAAVNQGPSVVTLKDVAFTTGCYFTISGTMSVTPLFNQL